MLGPEREREGGGGSRSAGTEREVNEHSASHSNKREEKEEGNKGIKGEKGHNRERK